MSLARPGRASLVIIAVWLVSLLFWIRPGVLLPDSGGYLALLTSTWLDRDLLFFDEWQSLGMVRDGVILHKEITRTEHLGNHWTVGSGLFWYPLYVVADAVRPLFAHFPRNGFSLPYNVAVVFGSALAGLITLLVGQRVASSSRAATIAAIGAWFGTPLLYYSLVTATLSHAVSAMACALVFAAALRLRDHDDDASLLLAGLAAGFAFLVRPQNAPFALVPLLLANVSRERRWRGVAIYAIGGLVAALPQFIVSTFVYGSPIGFVTGGGNATPFAAFQRVWTWEPLLSWYHGLVPWTPFAAIGIIGIALFFHSDRRLAWACSLAFVSQWLINATMERSYWGAYSFGQRRFDNCTIVFLIGAAVVIDRLGPKIGAMLVAATSLWTMSLFFATYRGLDLSAYYTPAELLARQGDGLRHALALLRPFVAVPPAMRGQLLALIVAFALVAIAVAVLVARLRPLPAAVTASLFFIAFSAFFTYCGLRDSARIEPYRVLIDRNRPFAQVPGGADVRFGLLRDEIAYLRKSGREAAAQETERELAQLIDQRARSLQQLGLEDRR